MVHKRASWARSGTKTRDPQFLYSSLPLSLSLIGCVASMFRCRSHWLLAMTAMPRPPKEVQIHHTSRFQKLQVAASHNSPFRTTALRNPGGSYPPFEAASALLAALKCLRQVPQQEGEKVVEEMSTLDALECLGVCPANFEWFELNAPPAKGEKRRGRRFGGSFLVFFVFAKGLGF